jgi:outer membrane receptor for ferrienterochelin and colicins
MLGPEGRLGTGPGARRRARVEHQRGLLLASTVVGQPLAGGAGHHAGIGQRQTSTSTTQLTLSLGVDNLTNVDLVAKSALFTYAEAPRTWRVSLRGRW